MIAPSPLPSRRSRNQFLSLLIAAASLALTINCPAATVTWDINAGTAGAQDGAGTWNTTTTNWWNGASDVAWPNTTADTAIFGAGSGAAGAVTVSGTVIANSLTFNAPGSGNYTVSGGTISLGGTSPTITQNVDNGGGATVNAILAGSAGLSTSVTASTGTAGLSLGGANTYTGATIIGGIGRTALFNTSALGAVGAGNGTTVNSGATLALATTGTYAAEALTLNGTGTANAGALRFSTGGTNWTGSIALGSASLMVGAGSSATITGNIDLHGFALSRTGTAANAGDLWSGVISSTGGGGDLNFNGTAFTLTGANTYAGTTTVVSLSKLTISNSVATGSGSQTITNNGFGTSTVVLNGATGANTLALKNNGDGTTAAQALLFGNNVSVTNVNGSTFDVGNTNGTVLLNNSSTSTGATAQNKTLALGTLAISNQGGGAANTINVTGTDGYALAFGATTLAVNTTFNTGANLTLGSVTQSGGSRSLTKTGASTLTLGGTNNYAGATLVSAGTLLVTGDSSAATGAVTVSPSATLGGTGTIGGATTVSGVLAPGITQGALSLLGNLTLAAGSSTVMDVAGVTRGSTYDAVDLASGKTLAYGGTLTLNISAPLADGATYDLFGFDTADTGGWSAINFAGGLYSGTFTESTLGSGFWTASLTSGQNQILTFSEITGDLSVVPEPAIMWLLLGGLILPVFLRIRSSQRANNGIV